MNMKEPINRELRTEAVRYLEAAKLYQRPPRRRSMMFLDDDIQDGKGNWITNSYIKRFQFPWMSFGTVVGKLSEAVCLCPNQTNKYVFPLIFIHARPWVDLNDAVDVLCSLGGYFYHMMGVGSFCAGEVAQQQIAAGTISSEEAFWFTENEGGSEAYCPNFQRYLTSGSFEPTRWSPLMDNYQGFEPFAPGMNVDHKCPQDDRDDEE